MHPPSDDPGAFLKDQSGDLNAEALEEGMEIDSDSLSAGADGAMDVERRETLSTPSSPVRHASSDAPASTQAAEVDDGPQSTASSPLSSLTSFHSDSEDEPEDTMETGSDQPILNGRARSPPPVRPTEADAAHHGPSPRGMGPPDDPREPHSSNVELSGDAREQASRPDSSPQCAGAIYTPPIHATPRDDILLTLSSASAIDAGTTDDSTTPCPHTASMTSLASSPIALAGELERQQYNYSPGPSCDLASSPPLPTQPSEKTASTPQAALGELLTHSTVIPCPQAGNLGRSTTVLLPVHSPVEDLPEQDSRGMVGIPVGGCTVKDFAIHSLTQSSPRRGGTGKAPTTSEHLPEPDSPETQEVTGEPSTAGEDLPESPEQESPETQAESGKAFTHLQSLRLPATSRSTAEAAPSQAENFEASRPIVDHPVPSLEQGPPAAGEPCTPQHSSSFPKSPHSATTPTMGNVPTERPKPPVNVLKDSPAPLLEKSAPETRAAPCQSAPAATPPTTAPNMEKATSPSLTPITATEDAPSSWEQRCTRIRDSYTRYNLTLGRFTLIKATQGKGKGKARTRAKAQEVEEQNFYVIHLSNPSLTQAILTDKSVANLRRLRGEILDHLPSSRTERRNELNVIRRVARFARVKTSPPSIHQAVLDEETAMIENWNYRKFIISSMLIVAKAHDVDEVGGR